MKEFIKQEDVNEFYKSLAMADTINTMVFGNSKESSINFAKSVALEFLILAALIEDKDSFVEGSEVAFKEELQKKLNLCLENEELTSEYGKAWFAEGDKMTTMLNMIEDAGKQIQLENLQSKFN